MVYFEIYRDRAGEYRWRLIAGNGEIVGTSEGYSSKQNAINSANWVKQNTFMAGIRDNA